MRLQAMNKLNYYGPFKTYIQDFIELKQAIGYKYLTEARQLKRFDTFTVEKYNLVDALSKEIVLDWCSKKSH